MTPSELKYHVSRTNEDSHYFDRKTMRAFGDTMRNYGVRSATVKSVYDAESNFNGIDKDTGKPITVDIECWELYRKNSVKCGNKESAYWAKATFHRVYPSNE